MVITLINYICAYGHFVVFMVNLLFNYLIYDKVF